MQTREERTFARGGKHGIARRPKRTAANRDAADGVSGTTGVYDPDSEEAEPVKSAKERSAGEFRKSG